jgi:hypothetical protein
VAWPAPSPAQNVVLDHLTLDAPTGTTNRLSITLQTNIGTDSEISNVTGRMSGLLDFSYSAGQITPTGITLTGGDIATSNVTFSFLFGLVTVRTEDVGGTPSTPNPPSLITSGMFNGSDHVVTLNRGRIIAPGQTTDLATSPIPVTGSGQGSAIVTTLGANQYETVFRLPVQFNEPFEVMNVPLVGTVTGNIIGSGTLVARQQFTWVPLPGDYDFDGDLDCADIDHLQAQILSGSTDLTFDVNGDGLVTLLDYTAWITDLKQTLLGDANLDRFVDGVDFNTWNAHKSMIGQGWCSGDFTGEGAVDQIDFGVWDANKFMQAASVSVPEPATVWWCLLGGWIAACGGRVRCRSACSFDRATGSSNRGVSPRSPGL